MNKQVYLLGLVNLCGEEIFHTNDGVIAYFYFEFFILLF